MQKSTENVMCDPIASLNLFVHSNRKINLFHNFKIAKVYQYFCIVLLLPFLLKLFYRLFFKKE